MTTQFNPNHSFLVFDTETAGLPKSYKKDWRDTTNWPRIVQFGMELHYPDGTHESFCELVRPSNGMAFPIPGDASAIHGITDRDCVERGTDISIIIDTFSLWIRKADAVVCHNYNFDSKVLKCEMARAGKMPNTSLGQGGVKPLHICTMAGGTEDLTQIEIESDWGDRYYKWPTLQELHMHLFGHGFDKAHDALADVQATVRCYRRLVETGFFKNFNGVNFLPIQDA